MRRGQSEIKNDLSWTTPNNKRKMYTIQTEFNIIIHNKVIVRRGGERDGEKGTQRRNLDLICFVHIGKNEVSFPSNDYSWRTFKKKSVKSYQLERTADEAFSLSPTLTNSFPLGNGSFTEFQLVQFVPQSCKLAEVLTHRD